MGGSAASPTSCKVPEHETDPRGHLPYIAHPTDSTLDWILCDDAHRRISSQVRQATSSRRNTASRRAIPHGEELVTKGRNTSPRSSSILDLTYCRLIRLDRRRRVFWCERFPMSGSTANGRDVVGYAAIMKQNARYRAHPQIPLCWFSCISCPAARRNTRQMAKRDERTCIHCALNMSSWISSHRSCLGQSRTGDFRPKKPPGMCFAMYVFLEVPGYGKCGGFDIVRC
jgi:hypothetical protein